MEKNSVFQKMKQIFQGEEDEAGVLGLEASELIKNIFRYMDKDAKDIMTHRKNIIAIEDEESLEDVLHFMLSEKYSRFPVYHESIDEIIGMLHLRDVMSCYLEEESRKKPITEYADYIRPVSFIPETKSIDALFKQMQADKNHIAIVLDEYGQTSGLVAMEDILEEIVGNILDEYDDEDEQIIKQPDGSLLVNGMATLEELEEMLHVPFEKEECETLNGFFIHRLDRIPSEEDVNIVEHEGYRFVALSVENNMIETVKIEKMLEEC